MKLITHPTPRRNIRIRRLGAAIALACSAAAAPISHAQVEEPIQREADLDGVAIVLVKDFMAIRNSGEGLENVEFQRYVPITDEEQIVLGRWVSASTDEPAGVPVIIAKIEEDPQRNLIHTFRLLTVPAHQHVTVTVTSLVARRERPAPQGEFAILKPDEYPKPVRPYLSSTKMVNCTHPEIAAEAQKILATTTDALGVAKAVADLMRTKSYIMQGQPDMSQPTSVMVLRHGGSCCGSAVCASAILRACGVPTQVTYSPAGYVHGVIRFYLNGYGWVRMDATSGVGTLPMIQDADDRGMVRLFDMPIEMEELSYAYAWPYQHNTMHDEYRFLHDGDPVTGLAFA
ncbi:MAG: transglutaminase family protein, partial [Phycisphaerales bacterium]|nr:transglutaminase family protein [Phycisphaerales bacterium]